MGSAYERTANSSGVRRNLPDPPAQRPIRAWSLPPREHEPNLPARSMTPFLTIQTASAYLPHIFRLNFLHLPLIITRRERRRSLGTTKGKAPKEGGGPEKKE